MTRTASRRAPARDVALCLRRFPYGDSSLVARLLTPDAGKLQVLAKGAFRPTSRYFGVLDLFDDLEIVWRGRARGGLALMTEGRVLQRRRALTRDLARYRAASGLLEMVDLVAREGEPERELFALAQNGLDTLATTSADPPMVAVAFDLQLLATLGLRPALEDCASCGKPPGRTEGREAPYSAALGGRLCADCAGSANARVRRASLHTLGIARSLMATPLSGLDRIRVGGPALASVQNLVQDFLDQHLEARPRSRRTRPARGARDGRNGRRQAAPQR